MNQSAMCHVPCAMYHVPCTMPPGDEEFVARVVIRKTVMEIFFLI